MKPLPTLLASAALAGFAMSATAQTASQAPAASQPATNSPVAGSAGATGKPVTGATVYDTQGGQVGTIKSITGANAVVSTGMHDVQLPLSSFASGTNGPVIAMTRAQLDQAASGAAATQQANLSSQLTVGSKIKDQQGGEVGTVAANDGQFVTVQTAKNKVKLPMNAFAGSPAGAVIGMTAAQLDAAAAKAAPTGG